MGYGSKLQKGIRGRMNTWLTPHCCARVPIDWELISPDFLKMRPGTVRVMLINPSVMCVAIQKNDTNTALGMITHCSGDLCSKGKKLQLWNNFGVIQKTFIIIALNLQCIFVFTVFEKLKGYLCNHSSWLKSW